MRAHVLAEQAPAEEHPLQLREIPHPAPADNELLVRIEACAVCRTDLHIIEGDVPLHKCPVVPGHQIVGTVVQIGASVTGWTVGERAGIAWLRTTCGACKHCQRGQENLCPHATFTGWDADGGFAEYTTVPADYAYRIPSGVAPEQAAPLLCAGIIGYRAIRRAEVRPGSTVVIVGFGSSAHIVMQILQYWGCEVFVYSRQAHHRELALQLGAAWTGQLGEPLPHPADHAIVFAPAGKVVPPVLEQLDRGGILSIAGIYMSPIPELNYEKHLYYEKQVRSVTANTREDGRELLELAARIPIRPQITTYSFEEVGRALIDLKKDRLQGTGVVLVSSTEETRDENQ